MQRATSILLLCGGAALLATWLISPALSSAERRRAFSSPDKTPPETAALDAAVTALHDHVSPPRAYATPLRDPFTFTGGVASRATEGTSVPVVAAMRPPPTLPLLVAILSKSTSDAGTGFRAALSIGGDVELAGEGDAVGALVVSTVSATTVVLQDPRTSRTFTLSLR